MFFCGRGVTREPTKILGKKELDGFTVNNSGSNRVSLWLILRALLRKGCVVRPNYDTTVPTNTRPMHHAMLSLSNKPSLEAANDASVSFGGVGIHARAARELIFLRSFKTERLEDMRN